MYGSKTKNDTDLVANLRNIRVMILNACERWVHQRRYVLKVEAVVCLPIRAALGRQKSQIYLPWARLRKPLRSRTLSLYPSAHVFILGILAFS